MFVSKLSTENCIWYYLYIWYSLTPLHLYLSPLWFAIFPHALSLFVGISWSWRVLDYVVLAMLVCLCVWRDRYQGFWQFGLCCRFSRLVGRVVNAGVAAVVLLLRRLPSCARSAAAVRAVRCSALLTALLAAVAPFSSCFVCVVFVVVVVLYIFRKLPMRRST